MIPGIFWYKTDCEVVLTSKLLMCTFFIGKNYWEDLFESVSLLLSPVQVGCVFYFYSDEILGYPYTNESYRRRLFLILLCFSLSLAQTSESYSAVLSCGRFFMLYKDPLQVDQHFSKRLVHKV